MAVALDVVTFVAQLTSLAASIPVGVAVETVSHQMAMRLVPRQSLPKKNLHTLVKSC